MANIITEPQQEYKFAPYFCLPVFTRLF